MLYKRPYPFAQSFIHLIAFECYDMLDARIMELKEVLMEPGRLIGEGFWNNYTVKEKLGSTVYYKGVGREIGTYIAGGVKSHVTSTKSYLAMSVKIHIFFDPAVPSLGVNSTDTIVSVCKNIQYRII